VLSLGRSLLARSPPGFRGRAGVLMFTAENETPNNTVSRLSASA
jgi:hypothetical protein